MFAPLLHRSGPASVKSPNTPFLGMVTQEIEGCIRRCKRMNVIFSRLLKCLLQRDGNTKLPVIISTRVAILEFYSRPNIESI